MELDASMDPSMEAPTGPAGAGMDADQEMPGAEDKPLNATEIEKEADKIAGDDAGDSDQEVANQLKAEQDAEMQAQQERQELMQPQIDKLNTNLGALQTGIQQGQAQTADAGQAFGGLDKEMAALKQVIANIQKTMA